MWSTETEKLDKGRSRYGPSFASTYPCVLMFGDRGEIQSIIPQIYLDPNMC